MNDNLLIEGCEPIPLQEKVVFTEMWCVFSWCRHRWGQSWVLRRYGLTSEDAARKVAEKYLDDGHAVRIVRIPGDKT